MKTNVAQASLEAHSRIGAVMADQETRVMAFCKFGKVFTRRELGVLAGIENSAAARTVNGLVKAQRLAEVGTKVCPHTGYRVGAVSLSWTEGA